jgi:transposase
MGTLLLCPGCCQRDRRIAELVNSNTRLQTERDHLQAERDHLQAQLEQAQRASKRQAAPFSKGEPNTKPKSTARPRGDAYGKHGHRPIPPDDQIDETLEAPLPTCCPHCGGDIAEDDRVDEQFQEEIPIKPIRRRIRIHTGNCRCCGRRVRGRHPQQTSDAVGAAASQVGPDAQATIVYLNKHSGLSYGKISDLFERTYGIHLTRSACTQAVLRIGRKLQPVYQEIQRHIRDTEYLTPDETGWRIGGHPVWLHGWVADDGATCFAIDPRRSAQVLEETIGCDWSGNLTHDGYSSYDRFGDAVHQQCLAHPLRRAHVMIDNAIGRAKDFPRRVIDLFQEALEVRDQFHAGRLDAAKLLRAHEDYTERLRDLSIRPYVNAANERLAKHLYNHTGAWFMFLVDPRIPATNYRGEQALRVPIVNRKVWGGNRTTAGAEVQVINASVIATCKNRLQSAISFISQAACGFVGSLFTSAARS